MPGASSPISSLEDKPFSKLRERGFEMKKFKKLLVNKKGQGLLEYVMLLAVVAAIVLAFKGKITDYVNKLTDSVGTQAEQVISNN